MELIADPTGEHQLAPALRGVADSGSAPPPHGRFDPATHAALRPCEHIQQGCLAGAVRTNKQSDCAEWEGERCFTQEIGTPGRPRRITSDAIVNAGATLTLPALTVRGVAAELGVSEMSIYRRVGDIEGLRRLVAEGIVARAEFTLPNSDDVEDALVAVAEHAVALAALNPRSHQKPRDANGLATEATAIRAGAHAFSVLTPASHFTWSIRATARGAIALLGLPALSDSPL